MCYVPKLFWPFPPPLQKKKKNLSASTVASNECIATISILFTSHCVEVDVPLSLR